MYKDIQQKKNYLICMNSQRAVSVNSNIELILFLTLSLLLVQIAQFSNPIDLAKDIKVPCTI